MPAPSATTGLLETTGDLLTPGEVARLFRVDPKTVTRWEKHGRLTSLKTLGGHRRYPTSQITALLTAHPEENEIIRALEDVHTLATDTGALTEAARIAHLITALRVRD